MNAKLKTKPDTDSGWFKPSPEVTTDQAGAFVSSGATSSRFKASHTKLKFEDFYPDSEDEVKDKGDQSEVMIKKHESSVPILDSTCTAGSSLTKALEELKIEKKDSRNPQEENQTHSDSSKLNKCTYCKKQGNMLKCSRCQQAWYCDRQCQISDYQQHKHICKASKKKADSEKETEKKKMTDGDHSLSNWSSCSFCSKEGYMLKCSRCQLTSYCNQQCQKSHYKKHKVICRRKELFNLAMSKFPEILRRGIIAEAGSFKVSDLLDDLPAEIDYMYGMRAVVMLEIIGPYPHIFRYGITVRDVIGQLTHILFYAETDVYNHVTSDRGAPVVPMPLSRCLRVGNFIILLNSHFHGFRDGTVGIRIDDLDDVHFILQD